MGKRLLAATCASTVGYCIVLLLTYLGKPGDKSGLGFVIILIAVWSVGIALGFALFFWFVFDALERRKRGARSVRVEAVAVVYGVILLAGLAWLASAI